MSGSMQPVQPSTASFEALALGYGKRRIIMVGALLGGLCVTAAGLGWAVSSALLGMGAESGLVMIAVGAALVFLGWLATVGIRFTRKLPKPILDAKNMESNLRINVIAMWIVAGLVWAACLALFLFSPRGREPDAASLLPSFMAFPACLVAGVLYLQSIMRRRNDLYARWLSATGR